MMMLTYVKGLGMQLHGCAACTGTVQNGLDYTCCNKDMSSKAWKQETGTLHMTCQSCFTSCNAHNNSAHSMCKCH